MIRGLELGTEVCRLGATSAVAKERGVTGDVGYVAEDVARAVPEIVQEAGERNVVER